MNNWQNEQLTKWTADKMNSWQNEQLTKWTIDKMSSWLNEQFTKWTVDKMNSQQNEQLTKWTADKMNSWQNEQLTNWTVDKMNRWQNEQLTKWTVDKNIPRNKYELAMDIYLTKTGLRIWFTKWQVGKAWHWQNDLMTKARSWKFDHSTNLRGAKKSELKSFFVRVRSLSPDGRGFRDYSNKLYWLPFETLKKEAQVFENNNIFNSRVFNKIIKWGKWEEMSWMISVCKYLLLLFWFFATKLFKTFFFKCIHFILRGMTFLIAIAQYLDCSLRPC